MFKKIILSAVAIATLTTGAFALDPNRVYENEKRKNVCDDTAIGRSAMANLKADIGDLTISSVGRSGSLGIGKTITLNQICWKYYQEVEDSRDPEFKDLMNNFIKFFTTAPYNATGLAYLYSPAHDLPKQLTDVLASFAKGDIQKTKKQLKQYIWDEDIKYKNAFFSATFNHDGRDPRKIYEEYKERPYSSDLIVLWMETSLDAKGGWDELDKVQAEIDKALSK